MIANIQATPVTKWPGPDNSVLKALHDKTAHEVARQLIELYQQARGRNEAFISRDRLFDLYQLALRAGTAPGARCESAETEVMDVSRRPGAFAPP